MNKNILYKSMPADMICNGHKYEVGVWYKIKGKIEICKNGFHTSKNIVDAMSYVTPGILAKVEVRGESIIDKDKQCWGEIRIIKIYKWTRKDSISLAIFAAESCIDNFEKEYPNDTRPREAIEAAKRVLENNTMKNTDAARSAANAARSAAGSAAWSAAWSAANAAGSAAGSAAWSAAWSAARSAAVATGSATGSVANAAEEIKNKIHKFIIMRSKL